MVLRGTNDSGKLTSLTKNVQHNDGNIRALLRIRVLCDNKYLIIQLKKNTN